MTEKIKSEDNELEEKESVEPEQNGRRDFLRSLGRWSAIIIGGVTLGGMVAPPDAAGWVNGGGGAAWVNGRGGYGGGSWVNKAGGGGAGWVNRAGGGGAGWVNRAGGGGSWVNRRGW